MTRFVVVSAMTRLIESFGLARMIGELTVCIEDDFPR